MKAAKHAYFDRFRCLAGACPDSCCKEWEVQVDEASAAAYRSLSGPLGDRLRQVLRTEDGETVMTITDGRCPMWQQDGLCRVQAELGAEALCTTCREFPRLTHDYGDFVERGLELSCPEAARLILTAPYGPMEEEDLPGEGEADYDEEAMGILKTSREEALKLLSEPERPVPEALVLLLFYGLEVQSALDGGELAAFSPEAALASAAELARPGELGEMLAFFRGLEILTPQWEAMLQSPAPGTWEEPHRALARYFVERYWLQAVSDYDLYSRVKLALTGCLLVKHLGGDMFRTAQLFSKEIENNAQNVDAILDGAYTCSALTDDKLLGLLLGG